MTVATGEPTETDLVALVVALLSLLTRGPAPLGTTGQDAGPADDGEPAVILGYD